jgi:hypothetical protein
VTLLLTACAPAPPLAVTVATKEFVLGPLGTPLLLLHPPVTPKNARVSNSSLRCHERFFLGHAKRTAQASVAPPNERASL